MTTTLTAFPFEAPRSMTVARKHNLLIRSGLSHRPAPTNEGRRRPAIITPDRNADFIGNVLALGLFAMILPTSLYCLANIWHFTLNGSLDAAIRAFLG